jgi:hypothetical protein
VQGEPSAGFVDGHAGASIIAFVVQLQLRPPASDVLLTRQMQLSLPYMQSWAAVQVDPSAGLVPGQVLASVVPESTGLPAAPAVPPVAPPPPVEPPPPLAPPPPVAPALPAVPVVVVPPAPPDPPLPADPVVPALPAAPVVVVALPPLPAEPVVVAVLPPLPAEPAFEPAAPVLEPAVPVAPVVVAESSPPQRITLMALRNRMDDTIVRFIDFPPTSSNKTAALDVLIRFAVREKRATIREVSQPRAIDSRLTRMSCECVGTARHDRRGTSVDQRGHVSVWPATRISVSRSRPLQSL